MHGIVSILIVLVPLLFPQMIAAQVRGDGVGALLGRTEGEQTIEITNGKTAPRGQVFIENQNGEVQVEAALDGRGIFNFSFQTSVEDSATLYIYAQDDIGLTPKISFSTPGVDGILMPPTITVEGEPVEGKPVTIYGFTHPNASVDLVVRDVTTGETIETRSTVADGGSGRWLVSLSDMAQGAYTAVATSTLGTNASLPSNPLTVRVDVTITTKIISAASKVLLVPAAAVALAPAGVGFADLYYYLMRLILGIRGLIYFPNRKKVRWGVVYNALTKGFVSGAIVRLYKESGGLVETEVTGLTGSFSFLPEPGKYTLRVTKPGMRFPSQMVSGAIDGEYSPVYHGEQFGVRDFNTALTLSIPVDPQDAKQGMISAMRQSIRQYRLIIEVLLLLVGLGLSVFVSIIQPIWYNQFVIFVYILILFVVLVQSWRRKLLWGMVKDEHGKPAPLVSLSLLDSTFHRQVQRRVSDQYGRYQFVAPSGTYQITVSSDNWEMVTDGRGYKGGDIVVKKNVDIIKPTVVVRQKR